MQGQIALSVTRNGLRRLVTVIATVGMAACGFSQTDWSGPFTVGGTLGTSATAVSAPALATDGSGAVTATWLGSWGTNTTTGGATFNIARHSDVYVATSNNWGLVWQNRHQLSNPRLINSIPNIMRSPNNIVRVVWPGGDALSGFRLHTATSLNGGITFTTNTRLQNVTDTNQGFMDPQIVSTPSNLVMGWNGLTHGGPQSPVLNYSTDSGTSWNAIPVADVPSTATEGTLTFAPTMAVSGTEIIVPLWMVYKSSPFPPITYRYEVVVMISHDEGLTWETRHGITTPGVNVSGYDLATDGNGKWFLFWSGYTQPTFSDFKLYVQTSTDAGAHWSQPAVILDNGALRSVSTDGLGRWLAMLSSPVPGPIQYIWSNDNGVTWSPVQSITGSKASMAGEKSVFLGDGKWGVAWADNTLIKMSRLQWGPSGVSDWVLY